MYKILALIKSGKRLQNYKKFTQLYKKKVEENNLYLMRLQRKTELARLKHFQDDFGRVNTPSPVSDRELLNRAFGNCVNNNTSLLNPTPTPKLVDQHSSCKVPVLVVTDSSTTSTQPSPDSVLTKCVARKYKQSAFKKNCDSLPKKKVTTVFDKAVKLPRKNKKKRNPKYKFQSADKAYHCSKIREKRPLRMGDKGYHRPHPEDKIRYRVCLT